MTSPALYPHRHLLGIEDGLLPRNAAEQERLEEIYLLTRPVVDDYCRALVASINREFLVPEIEGVLPGPLARQAPRVAAENAARADTPLPGVRCRIAARTVAHGLSPVTGLSEPKARGTPWDANSANGLSVAARETPRRWAYIPSGPPQ